MTETEALDAALNLTGSDIERGKELLKLEPFIDPKKFGNLWEAFVASVPIEVVIELDELKD